MSEKPWDELELVLIDAMHGSNMIEKPGTSLEITTTLCHAVFRDEDVIAELDEADPTYVVHQQALVDLGRDSNRDSVIESRADVINHARAFLYMAERVILNDEPLSEYMIREMHRILAAGMHINDDLIPGQYRTHEVAVRYDNGKVSRTMRARHVPGKMAQMVADLAAHEDLSAAASSVAALCHQIFVYIHPFADGNGRLGRILLNVLLLKQARWVSVIGLSKEDRKMYQDELTKGCRKYHEQDGEVSYEEQTAHLEFEKFVLAHTR